MFIYSFFLYYKSGIGLKKNMTPDVSIRRHISYDRFEIC